MSGPIEQAIPASLKSMVPAGMKDTLRKLKPRTRLQKDLELFVLNGTRFTPPLADFPPMVLRIRMMWSPSHPVARKTRPRT